MDVVNPQMPIIRLLKLCSTNTLGRGVEGRGKGGDAWAVHLISNPIWRVRIHKFAHRGAGYTNRAD